MFGFNPPPRKVFISYSRKDKRSKDQLKKNFTPVIENGNLNVWIDESNIDVGDDWERKIDKALTESELAVLLMSENFFDSEYIRKKELPYIIKNAKKKRMSVVPVSIRKSGWKEYDSLRKLQVIGEAKPLQTIKSTADRQEAWQNVVDTVVGILNDNPAPASWASLTRRWTIFSVLGAIFGFLAATYLPNIVQQVEIFPEVFQATIMPFAPGFLIGLSIGLFQLIAISRYITRATLWFLCCLVGWVFMFNLEFTASPLYNGALLGGVIGSAQGLMVWSKYAARNYFWWILGFLLWFMVSSLAYALGFWGVSVGAEQSSLLFCGATIDGCIFTNPLHPLYGLVFGTLFGLSSSPVLALLVNRIARRKQM